MPQVMEKVRQANILRNSHFYAYGCIFWNYMDAFGAVQLFFNARIISSMCNVFHTHTHAEGRKDRRCTTCAKCLTLRHFHFRSPLALQVARFGLCDAFQNILLNKIFEIAFEVFEIVIQATEHKLKSCEREKKRKL